MRKGVIITWALNDIRTTAEHLSGAGFDKYLPSNGAKTALIKALKKYTKGNERLYKRWDDTNGYAKFTVFEQEIQEGELELNKELTIELNKSTGEIKPLPEHRPSFDRIKELYDLEGPTLNTDQFRAIIQNIIHSDLRGFAIRKGGGVYFVDDRFRDQLERLRKLFDMFPMNAILHIIPVYNDQETLDTLEHHASESLFGQIDNLIDDIQREFDKGTINIKKLENRKEKADEIFELIATHKENLRGAYDKVSQRLNAVSLALGKVENKVRDGIQESEDFMTMLQAI